MQKFNKKNKIKLGEYAVRFIIIKEGIDPVCSMSELLDLLYRERITCDHVVFVCFKACNREELLKHPPSTISELTHVLFTMALDDNIAFTEPLLKRIKKCAQRKNIFVRFMENIRVFKRAKR